MLSGPGPEAGEPADPAAWRAYVWANMLAHVGTYPDVTAPSVRSAASQRRELDRDPLRDRPFSRFNF